MRRTLVALAAAAMLAMPMTIGPSEALAQPQDADGVVTVQIGDITLTDTLDLAAAAIVQACGIQAANQVNVLNILNRIDQKGGQHTFCKAETGKVKAGNN